MEGQTNKTDFIDPSFSTGDQKNGCVTDTSCQVLSASYKVLILVSSAEFRRSSDKIPRFMGSCEDAGCFLKDDGVEPNSLGGWIGILTLPCTILYFYPGFQ